MKAKYQVYYRFGDGLIVWGKPTEYQQEAISIAKEMSEGYAFQWVVMKITEKEIYST
jgi:hypothetical protein